MQEKFGRSAFGNIIKAMMIVMYLGAFIGPWNDSMLSSIGSVVVWHVIVKLIVGFFPRFVNPGLK